MGVFGDRDLEEVAEELRGLRESNRMAAEDMRKDQELLKSQDVRIAQLAAENTWWRKNFGWED